MLVRSDGEVFSAVAYEDTRTAFDFFDVEVDRYAGIGGSRAEGEVPVARVVTTVVSEFIFMAVFPLGCLGDVVSVLSESVVLEPVAGVVAE